MSNNLSDVSDLFLAKLSALADSNLTSTGPERVESGSKLQPPSLTRTQLHLESIDRPWSNEVQQILRDQFHRSGFRYNQLEAINATLASKNAFVLMLTSGGKSLYY
ncbi:hypothetical protein F4824DRAFT_504364 [Ustulina deusta]|nr:hypothetical protein F4824DRAFT_504364 [Ustulina deusta]